MIKSLLSLSSRSRFSLALPPLRFMWFIMFGILLNSPISLIQCQGQSKPGDGVYCETKTMYWGNKGDGFDEDVGLNIFIHAKDEAESPCVLRYGTKKHNWGAGERLPTFTAADGKTMVGFSSGPAIAAVAAKAATATLTAATDAAAAAKAAAAAATTAAAAAATQADTAKAAATTAAAAAVAAAATAAGGSVFSSVSSAGRLRREKQKRKRKQHLMTNKSAILMPLIEASYASTKETKKTTITPAEGEGNQQHGEQQSSLPSRPAAAAGGAMFFDPSKPIMMLSHGWNDVKSMISEHNHFTTDQWSSYGNKMWSSHMGREYPKDCADTNTDILNLPGCEHLEGTVFPAGSLPGCADLTKKGECLPKNHVAQTWVKKDYNVLFIEWRSISTRDCGLTFNMGAGPYRVDRDLHAKGIPQKIFTLLKGLLKKTDWHKHCPDCEIRLAGNSIGAQMVLALGAEIRDSGYRHHLQRIALLDPWWSFSRTQRRSQEGKVRSLFKRLKEQPLAPPTEQPPLLPAPSSGHVPAVLLVWYRTTGVLGLTHHLLYKRSYQDLKSMAIFVHLEMEYLNAGTFISGRHESAIGMYLFGMVWSQSKGPKATKSCKASCGLFTSGSCCSDITPMPVPTARLATSQLKTYCPEPTAGTPAATAENAWQFKCQKRFNQQRHEKSTGTFWDYDDVYHVTPPKS